MKLPNPKNYDFIWLVENFKFFYVSIFLHRLYWKYGFLLTNNYGQWKVYLRKIDRKKLSRVGLHIFLKGFKQYEEKIRKTKKLADRSFQSMKNEKFFEVPSMVLSKKFLQYIKIFQNVWELYFYTEYFIHDGIQESLEKDQGNKFLIQQVRRMQKLKFSLRKYINNIAFQDKVLDTYLKKINRNIKRRDLYHLHYGEIADLLQGKKVSSKLRDIYVWGKFNHWRLVSGNNALVLMKKFDAYFEAEKDVSILKGFSANRGYYRGRIKIIHFDVTGKMSHDIEKMKKGNVLVTGSTGPEMILACRKAGAIVTEEGGICSHAAIVSRELNIPCIIGTKIATKVLKDGDMVEVDAEKGIVRKL